jgi:hypothetical protein
VIFSPPQSAVISADEQYRYFLSRSWIGGEGVVAFIGLNPSTADARVDDPTIRRCVAFAKQWGCDSLWMLNLFAFRSTSPDKLGVITDPIGPENDAWLYDAVSKADIVVAAWGNHGNLHGRAERFLTNQAKPLQALKITKSGAPGHPLYIRSSTKLIPFP